MERFSLDDIRDTFRADIESFLQLGRAQLDSLLAQPPSHAALDSALYDSLHHQSERVAELVVRFGDLGASNCVHALTKLVTRARDTASACAEGLRREQALAALCLQGISAGEQALPLELAHDTAAAAQAVAAFLALQESSEAPVAHAAAAHEHQAHGELHGHLRTLHEALSSLLASIMPLLLPIVDASASQPVFAVVAHSAHAIHGSSSLVGAVGLASASARLEELATSGVALSKQNARQLQLTYTALLLCQDLVGALRDNLPKGNSRRFRGADHLAEVLERARPIAEGQDPFLLAEEPGVPESFDLQELAAPGETASPAPAAPASDEVAEFSFEAEPPPAPAQEVDAELRAVFLEEARGCSEELRLGLVELASLRDNASALARLHRIYHQLKGAAATIGLQALSRVALDLEDSIEALQPVPHTVGHAQVVALAERSRALFRAAGLELEVDLAAAPVAATPAFDAQAQAELDRIFREEALGLCADLRVVAEALAAAPSDETMPAMATSLERSFHKLKGSAVVSSARQVAQEAERMQHVCSDEATAGELARAVRQSLDTLLGLLGATDADLAAPARPASAIASEAPLATAPTDSRVEPQFDSRVPSAAPVRVAVTVDTEPSLWSAFVVEAQELIDGIEREVVALEQAKQPRSSLENLFRAFHTLKGAVNTVGLSPVGDYIHRLESFLERSLSPGILPPPNAIARLLSHCVDSIRANLRHAREGWVEIDLARLERAITNLHAPGTRSQSGMNPSLDGSQSVASAKSGDGSKSHGSATEASGTADQDRVIRVGVRRLDSLMNLAGELVVSRARMSRRVTMLRTLLNQLNACRQRLAERVEDFSERHQFQTLHGRTRTIPSQQQNHAVPAPAAAKSDAKSGALDRTRQAPADGVDAQFSELELDRYDDVNILARTLQEINSDISEIQRDVHGALDQFASESDTFSAIISGLQTEITQARMVPIDQLFLRLRRPVRDSADRERKDVRVVTVGDTVNLDKNIIDELYGPMLHLVRNSVSHGIESRDQRIRAGKDPVGTVTLSARQESGQILIEVRDDGGGIDRERLRRKGIERGLIAPDVALDDPAVLDLVFATGISTRDVAGTVAGRGIGCDVAKRVVERLNGHIRVSTEAGRGTAFVITLPLTLAIYRALMVQHGEQVLAIPLNFAERILDLAEHDVVRNGRDARIRVDGSYARLHDLSRELGQESSSEQPGTALMLRLGDQRTVVATDRVLGQEEIVVKSIGELLAGHPLFSGVTLTGDGRLILIVDVPGLFERLGEKNQTAVVDRSVVHPELLAATQQPDEQLRPVRILYVDDSLSVRKAAEKYLRTLGAEVTLAVDGVDALDKVRKGTFDMVFTDLEMPRMHGYELIRELRYVPAYKDMPLVVVTSRSGDKHRQQAEQLGATGYVTKPFSQDTLSSMIQRFTHAQDHNGVLMVSGATVGAR